MDERQAPDPRGRPGQPRHSVQPFDRASKKCPLALFQPEFKLCHGYGGIPPPFYVDMGEAIAHIALLCQIKGCYLPLITTTGKVDYRRTPGCSSYVECRRCQCALRWRGLRGARTCRAALGAHNSSRCCLVLEKLAWWNGPSRDRPQNNQKGSLGAITAPAPHASFTPVPPPPPLAHETNAVVEQLPVAPLLPRLEEPQEAGRARYRHPPRR